MALRNQPYFPLYVQDYLTDEKLSLCSWETQGIYIKILCILHKQKEYGKILFKQNAKQNESKVKYFADILIRLLPCQFNQMESALFELLENEVLSIDDHSLFQKRMVKDGAISEARSLAGKKGGGNPNLLKQKSKQTPKQRDKQNTEYEIEYESEIVNDNDTINNKPQKKQKNSLYTEFVKIHYEFYKEQTGLPYKFTKGDGDAIKSIITYLKQVAEEKQKEPAEIWKFILKNYELWDEFFKKQIKPVQINSNISNIILNIKKDGNRKKDRIEQHADVYKSLRAKYEEEERVANMG